MICKISTLARFSQLAFQFYVVQTELKTHHGFRSFVDAVLHFSLGTNEACGTIAQQGPILSCKKNWKPHLLAADGVGFLAITFVPHACTPHLNEAHRADTMHGW